MVGVTKAINEELYERAKESLKKVSRSGDVSRKLQAIKSAKEHGIKKVAEIFGVSRKAIMSWIKAFEKEGIEGLKLKPGRGRKNFITEQEKEIIKNWILEDHNITIKVIRIKIEEEFGKSIGKSAIYNLIKRLRFSYMTPRAQHYRQKEGSDVEFKKKS